MMDAQLVGFLVGDGFCTKKKRRKNYLVGFHQAKKKSQIIKVYMDLLVKEAGKQHPIIEMAPKDVVKVYVYSKSLYQTLKAIKDNPSEYFEKLSSKDKVKFIGGFIDAEGCVKCDRVILYNSDRALLFTMQNFIRFCGISSTLHYHHGCFELHIWSKSSREKLICLCRNFSVKLSRLSRRGACAPAFAGDCRSQ